VISQKSYKTDTAKVDKIFDLVTAVMQDPFQGVGKPEPLKYLREGFWSRRIDLEHRLAFNQKKPRAIVSLARDEFCSWFCWIILSIGEVASQNACNHQNQHSLGRTSRTAAR
jgi:Txe/YoeB family toxin of toxin-antitoxin system